MVGAIAMQGRFSMQVLSRVMVATSRSGGKALHVKCRHVVEVQRPRVAHGARTSSGCGTCAANLDAEVNMGTGCSRPSSSPSGTGVTRTNQRFVRDPSRGQPVGSENSAGGVPEIMA
jgi:hypothetical protein